MVAGYVPRNTNAFAPSKDVKFATGYDTGKISTLLKMKVYQELNILMKMVELPLILSLLVEVK